MCTIYETYKSYRGINHLRRVFAGRQSENGRSRKHTREKAVREERLRKKHSERRGRDQHRGGRAQIAQLLSGERQTG